VTGVRAHMAGAPKQRASATSTKSHDGSGKWRTKPKRAKMKLSPCWRACMGVTLLLILLGGSFGGYKYYRYRYPLKQRCPPEGDRFYDHCMEGRTHYLLKLDWDCKRLNACLLHVPQSHSLSVCVDGQPFAGLGPRRAEAMRMALSLDTGEKAMIGVGEIPSWLTDANAQALRGAPCMVDIVEDKGCWFCKPTAKPSDESNAGLRDKLRAVGGNEGDPEGDDE